MLLTALAVSLVVAVILAIRDGGTLTASLGDTDDAMRLVMMRALAAGQGWFDQRIDRLQPPLGVFMHWSRLIDGGLVLLNALLRTGLPPGQAEYATRFIWPLLWIPGVVWAALAVARRLGGGAAVFAAAIVAMIEVSLFIQFRPGRIDHHNIQICLCMLSLAGAALGSRRGSLLAGAATGLGLAIGLEALVFEVLIGGYFALNFLGGGDKDGRLLRTYAAALGVAAVGFYLIQTPPARLALAACDAVAINLVSAVAAAAVGLWLTARLTAGRGWRARLTGLAAAGLVSAGLYVGLDPNCLHGPFADVDPRLKQFWLPNVQEVRPIPRVWLRDHETVYSLMAPATFGLIAWIGLFSSRRRDPFLFLCGVVLLVGAVCGWSAIRMAGYANWFALPLIAAAVAALAKRYFGGVMLATAVGACLATPMLTSAAVSQADKAIKAATSKTKAAPKPAAKPRSPARRAAAGVRGDRCFHIASYSTLARQPVGLVLSEIDLGPFILANTKASSMVAPYHRLNWGMVEARKVLSTPSERAVDGARKLGVAYLLECPAHAGNADRVGMPADSLQKRLDANKPPSWLEPVPGPGPLRLYRVRPVAPAPIPAH